MIMGISSWKRFINFKNLVMNKIVKYGLFSVGLVMALLVGGCEDDIDPIVEKLDLDRVLMPLNLEAKVQNKTELKLSWALASDAIKYVVELHADSLEFTHLMNTYEITEGGNLVVKGLEGESLYSVRVKAVGEDKKDSRWAELTFKTDAENIMSKVADADIEANATTVHWTAGLAVTHLTYKKDGDSGDATKVELDEAAKTAGAYKLTGLTGETNYVVKIYNNAKQRGTTTFKTLVDIGNATPVQEGDDLKAILDAAEDGDVFAIFPGTYELGSYALTKSISLKGVYPADKPVIKGRFTYSVNVNSLVLNNVIMDGNDATVDNVVEFLATVTVGTIDMENCVIRNYAKHLIYNSDKVKANVTSITFTGCVVDNVRGDGGDGIDYRGGSLGTLLFKNTTFSNSFRSFIRMQVACNMTFANCTFYKVCCLDNKDNTGLFRTSTGTLTVESCLFVETGVETPVNVSSGNWCKNTGNMKATESYSNNYYYSCHNLWVGLYTSAPQGVAESGDPGFADAAKGDFKVSNEILRDKSVGDPRWLE